MPSGVALKQLEAGSKGYRIVSPGPGLDWVKQPSNLYLNSVYATNTITASSTVDVAMPDMEMYVPASGYYMVHFYVECTVSSVRSIGFIPYLNETTDGFTICWVSAYSPLTKYVVCATLNRSLYAGRLTLRWSSSGSTTMTAYKRRLTLIRGMGSPK